MTEHLIRRLLSRGILPASVVMAVLLAACAGQPAGGGADGPVRVPVEGGGSYLDITPAALSDMLDDKDFVFVNVHVPYEGEIAGTDLFIPYDQIGGQLDRLPADRAAKIVLYCRSGSMSAIAARTLVAEGFTNVWNLDGGMNAWKAQGFPLNES